MFETLLDCIYKQKCVVCGCSKTNEILCKKCLKSVHKLSAYAQKIIDNVQIFSALKYEDTTKNLIRNFKFNRRKSAAIPCAKLLFEYYLKIKDSIDTSNLILCPIPSHKVRVFSRGYCHTELICREFSNLSNIKCNFKLIKKVKNTTAQYKVRMNQKAKNVLGAYKINKKYYRGETVVIIDDLVTTGATLAEVIKELKKSGINDIICLTLACA